MALPTSAPVASAVSAAVGAPAAPSATIPAPTAIGNAQISGTVSAKPLSLKLTGEASSGSGAATATATAAPGVASTSSTPSKGKKIKGGLTLVFSPDEDGNDEEMEEGEEIDETALSFRETCMEERRAGLARYRAILGKVLVKRRAAAACTARSALAAAVAEP